MYSKILKLRTKGSVLFLHYTSVAEMLTSFSCMPLLYYRVAWMKCVLFSLPWAVDLSSTWARCDVPLRHKFIFLVQIVAIRDIIPPPLREAFNDVYIAYELMDTDLHQIIRSNQALSEEHCQVLVSFNLRNALLLSFFLLIFLLAVVWD